MDELDTLPQPDLIQSLILHLDSIASGDAALQSLVAIGADAIQELETFLVHGRPRSLSLARCRAVKALGSLNARDSLLRYLEHYKAPSDAVVLFAEDAVRTAVADELLTWKAEVVYVALLKASQERATTGLIHAVGEFHDTRSLPLLFLCLEDDICRQEAELALRKIPEETIQYSLAYLSGETNLRNSGPTTQRRLRSVLRLLIEMTSHDNYWQIVEKFLDNADPSISLAVIVLGLRNASETKILFLFRKLFSIAEHLNWLEEAEATKLIHAHPRMAHSVASQIVDQYLAADQSPDWLSPCWRLLNNALHLSILPPHTQEPG